MPAAQVTNITSVRRAKAKQLNKKKEVVAKRKHPVHQRLDAMGGRKAGYTVEWLASECGISSATIRNQLAGRHEMLPHNFDKMLSVLGIGENEYYRCGPTKAAIRN